MLYYVPELCQSFVGKAFRFTWLDLTDTAFKIVFHVPITGSFAGSVVHPQCIDFSDASLETIWLCATYLDCIIFVYYRIFRGLWRTALMDMKDATLKITVNAVNTKRLFSNYVAGDFAGTEVPHYWIGLTDAAVEGTWRLDATDVVANFTGIS